METLRRNAFRILGIPITAGEEQIARAGALSMHLSDAGADPATQPLDFPALGPVERNPSEIERAMMQLSAPQTRIRERLWWFCSPTPMPASGDQAESSPTPPRASWEITHDLALTELCRLLPGQIPLTEFRKWRSVIAEFHALSQSEHFIDGLHALETQGGFERTAPREETAAAARELPAQVLQLFLRNGDAAMDAADFPRFGLVLEILHDLAQCFPEETERHLIELGDRIEDFINSKCSAYEAPITSAWNRKNARDMLRDCTDAFRGCQQSVFPLFAEWEKQVFARYPERTERIRAAILQLLDRMIVSYDLSRNAWSSRKVREQALLLAGTSPKANEYRKALQAMLNPSSGNR